MERNGKDGGMDPDKRQEMVWGGPCNRQEMVVTESFLINGQKWYGGDLVTDKKW